MSTTPGSHQPRRRARRTHDGQQEEPEDGSVEALEQVRANLSGDLTPVQRTITRGLVEYALEQLALVEELKRARRREVTP